MVFRDNRRSCPRCQRGLDEAYTPLGHRFERCATCHGNWVDILTLRTMFEVMKPGVGIPDMQARSDSSQSLPCPSCRQPMARKHLHNLDLDLCDRHGVWFDGEELQQTLYRYALVD